MANFQGILHNPPTISDKTLQMLLAFLIIIQLNAD